MTVPAASNESFSMKEARRYFDDDSLTGQESYRILANYPDECRAVYQELLEKEGVSIPTKKQLPLRIKKWMDFCDKHLGKVISASMIVALAATILIIPRRRIR